MGRGPSWVPGRTQPPPPGTQRVAGGATRELDTTALDAVAARLKTSDSEFALKWLKLHGVSAVAYPPVGPTDADDVIDTLVKREFEKAAAPG
jgi:hypothetical protein